MTNKFMSRLEYKALIVLTGVLFILLIIAGYNGLLDETWDKLIEGLNGVLSRIP